MICCLTLDGSRQNNPSNRTYPTEYPPGKASTALYSRQAHPRRSQPVHAGRRTAGAHQAVGERGQGQGRPLPQPAGPRPPRPQPHEKRPDTEDVRCRHHHIPDSHVRVQTTSKGERRPRRRIKPSRQRHRLPRCALVPRHSG